jgi:hypothetical protein
MKLKSDDIPGDDESAQAAAEVEISTAAKLGIRIFLGIVCALAFAVFYGWMLVNRPGWFFAGVT